jgi:hypothetical protein
MGSIPPMSPNAKNTPHSANKDDLLCPYQKQKKIDRSKEKSHTPIAYSMRYFGSNRYPDNYKEENHKINKYVLNLQAPTKCPLQYSL